ncbi:hypothetical protein ACFH04_12885 [Streptomyces noboritoensis]|uniref:Uncharacterized protein n=1 Tax=Streptomyces noboritoensis TaxID=67337 RepID=A0ABV6TJC5_9ACTN
MLRRLAVVLVSLSAAACLTAGTAAAAVASDEPRELTPREQAGLAFAGQVLGSFLGGAPLRGAGL